jgi:hypothetical protein
MGEGVLSLFAGILMERIPAAKKAKRINQIIDTLQENGYQIVTSDLIDSAGKYIGKILNKK